MRHSLETFGLFKGPRENRRYIPLSLLECVVRELTKEQLLQFIQNIPREIMISTPYHRPSVTEEEIEKEQSQRVILSEQLLSFGP